MAFSDAVRAAAAAAKFSLASGSSVSRYALSAASSLAPQNLASWYRSDALAASRADAVSELMARLPRIATPEATTRTAPRAILARRLAAAPGRHGAARRRVRAKSPIGQSPAVGRIGVVGVVDVVSPLSLVVRSAGGL